MIYLDHNASTPVRPEVADAMLVALRDLGANPSSTHREGQRVRAAVDAARDQVAALVNARPDEVVFVSGGTEGDHLAVVGGALARRDAGRTVAFGAIEHHAVHGAAELLADLGWAHVTLPCDADGRVAPAAVDALPADTTLLSVMLANNETGVLQPVAEMAAHAHARGLRVHCDAVQAAGKVAVDVAALGVDYLVISGHKFGGPKGAAALIVRRGAPLVPLQRGTGHERGRRGGTENVPGIVGLGLAAERAAADLGVEIARLTALRERFEQGLLAAVPDAVIHGAHVPRLPNTINASFPGARADHLLLALDARGVAVSAGAACASGAVEPSPVLAAMAVPRALAISALRFSLGRTTTADEIEHALVALADAVRAARAGDGVTRLRVLAAMSGGVDSAVAAALSAEQGHEVTGVTLKLACYGKSPASPRACCTLDAMDDARRTAQRMGFAHHVLDAEAVFRERVLQPFADSYASGRTPYPCALCNQHLKFGDLVRRMELTGADVLVTGHYASIREAAPGDFGLYRAVDAAKDQTYALALVPRSALARVRLPLGEYSKAEVRAHAKRLGLAVWDKAESQDLCFVPDGDYAGYLTGALGETRGTAPGAFVDARGARLGTHRGVLHYTVGQRKGLGIAAVEPLYVLAIDADANTVTLGTRAELSSPGLLTERMNWLADPPADGTRVHVRIRYNHAGIGGTVRAAEGGAVEVRFDEPQAAVTPGQLAVLGDGERCLGGAAIVRALGSGAGA